MQKAIFEKKGLFNDKESKLSGIKNSWKYEKDLIIYNNTYNKFTISHFGRLINLIKNKVYF